MGQHFTDKIRKKMLGKVNNFYHSYHTLRSLEQIVRNFKRVLTVGKRLKNLMITQFKRMGGVE